MIGAQNAFVVDSDDDPLGQRYSPNPCRPAPRADDDEIRPVVAELAERRRENERAVRFDLGTERRSTVYAAP